MGLLFPAPYCQDLTGHADIQIGDSTAGRRGLSGGQRRRVTIAIEMIKGPALIFLDEPLSGEWGRALHAVHAVHSAHEALP